MKKLQIAAGVFCVALVAGLLAVYSAGSKSNDLNSDEIVQRIVSPDKTLEAVLVRSDQGATTPFAYSLYVIPKGDKPSSQGNEMLNADHIQDVSIAWSGRRLLTIKYRFARIYHFSNFCDGNFADNSRYTVEARLSPLSPGSALSLRDRS